MEEMDSKPYQPLSKGRHEMEMSYTSSSDESEDGRAAHHRSYTSRETLPDYTHELRLTLGSHRERQSNYSQPQTGTQGCCWLYFLGSWRAMGRPLGYKYILRSSDTVITQ